MPVPDLSGRMSLNSYLVVIFSSSFYISRYAVCRYYIDGKKTQRYNKKEFTVFSHIVS